MPLVSRDARAHPLDRVLLGAFYAVVIASLAGFATFGLHPELVARVPGAARTYGVIYANVGAAKVWIAWAVLAAVLTRAAGWRWVPAFGVVYALSFLSEFVGTGYGVPFGGYAYSDLLGAKWFGRVPHVIPLSWFCMVVPSFYFGRVVTRGRGRAARVMAAAAILLAWDLALDPAMSFLTPYWRWADSGPYYGMPWLNLAGWYLTGLALMAALVGLRADRWIDRLSAGWLGAYCLANLLMPVGMLVAAGLWLGVGTTLVALGALAAIGYFHHPRTRGLLPTRAEIHA